MGKLKTIALPVETWEKLKKIKDAEKAATFQEVIERLIQKTAGVPASMFGVDKKLKIKFTQKEHEEITKDTHE